VESERTLLLATNTASMQALARSLDAELEPLPAIDAPETFEAWRDEAVERPPRDRVVVSVWSDTHVSGALLGVDSKVWETRFERPYQLWNFALGAASRRCRDGGSIVGLVQAPAALDSPGWTPELGIGDGVSALVRSVAAAEGRRGVRANTVVTPLGLVSGEVIAPAPPLDAFPGRLENEVAGAIRLLLTPDAAGLTGRILSADGGRSL
jgi:NAD(P)-dependent dehydrogenase (short-subunit alcohol dehydrogenase family)